MINEVVLEGIVVKSWRFAGDVLFRIACYRDPDMPQKLLNETHDAADFVTIRVPKRKQKPQVVVERATLCACTVSCRAGITMRAWWILEGCPRR